MTKPLAKYVPPFTAEYGSIKDSKNRVLINADAVKENYDLAREIAEALNASGSRPFWVIETARTTYWDGHGVGDNAYFTDKIDDAMKFWDFGAAETVRCWLLEKQSGPPKLRSVEHMYVPAISMAS